MAMSEEEFLVAQLAASSQGYMNNLTRGSDEALRGNRTDWRRFLPGVGGRRQMPPQQQHYPPNYQQDFYPPPQQQSYGHHNGGFNMPPDPEYGDVPSEVSGQIRQYAVPNLPPELQDAAGIGAPLSNPVGGLNISGFNIPAYENREQTSSTSASSDEKFDYLIKEIKLLKRSVNTLTNLLKKSILLDGNNEAETKTPQPARNSEDSV